MVIISKTNSSFIRSKLNIVIFTVVCLVIIINIASFINNHLGLYTFPINPPFLEKLYGQSQYVRTDAISMLPDETIYAYAAWRYMHGENPAVFNADQPPLGKYFIGLSEIYFNNERITGPIFNILSLAALFVLSLLILKNYLWSITLVAFFSFEKLFMVQMLYAPLLDNIQLFFILLSFIFYIMSRDKIGYLIPAFVSLGLVMSTKFWVTGFMIFIIWFVYGALSKNISRLVLFVLTAPLSIITMMVVYLPSFLQGDSVKNFFGVQHYIYAFHQGKFNFDPTAVWDLLLLNRWHVPWENAVKQSTDWQWTWPLITSLSVLAIVKIIKSRNNLVKGQGLFSIWIIIYFGLLSVGTVLPRYLLPVLPALYVLSFWFIKESLERRNWFVKGLKFPHEKSDS